MGDGREGLDLEYGGLRKGESLADFLSSFAGLPEEEARRLAESILTSWTSEWRERGGESYERLIARGAKLLVAGLVLLVLLALLGAALLIWLFV